MPEVPDTVDDAISALPDSPTTEEVFEGTLPFSTRELASSATKRALAGGGGGGSSSAITDIISISGGPITLTDLTPASDGYVFQESDMTVNRQRGTDLSLGTGPQFNTPAAIISAAGGDFQAMTYFNANLTKGTGSVQRFMQLYTSGAFPQVDDYANPPDLGTDRLASLIDGLQVDDSCFSAPMFNVPPGGFVIAGPTFNGAQGAVDDSVAISVVIVAWRLGPVPA